MKVFTCDVCVFVSIGGGIYIVQVVLYLTYQEEERKSCVFMMFEVTVTMVYKLHICCIIFTVFIHIEARVSISYK